MIASKVVCDDTYSNKSWCVVGQGMFSLREINQMEREMCGYLEWILNVQHTELEVFTERVQAEFGTGVAPAGFDKPARKEALGVSAPTVGEPSSTTYGPVSTTIYPSPDSGEVSPASEPDSPSHSDTTSPASSAPHTPPSLEGDSQQPQVIVSTASATTIPKVMQTGGLVVSAAGKHDDLNDVNRPFAFAAPAVW